MMTCVLPDIGLGKASDMATNTNNSLWIKNDTGKIYPQPINADGAGVPWLAGTTRNYTSMYCYTDLSKTRVGNRMSLFTGEFNDAAYVFLDYSGTMTDIVQLPDVYAGRTVEVLESRNCTINDTVYNGALVVNADYTAGDTTYLILKLK